VVAKDLPPLANDCTAHGLLAAQQACWHGKAQLQLQLLLGVCTGCRPCCLVATAAVAAAVIGNRAC